MINLGSVMTLFQLDVCAYQHWCFSFYSFQSRVFSKFVNTSSFVYACLTSHNCMKDCIFYMNNDPWNVIDS